MKWIRHSRCKISGNQMTYQQRLCRMRVPLILLVVLSHNSYRMHLGPSPFWTCARVLAKPHTLRNRPFLVIVSVKLGSRHVDLCISSVFKTGSAYSNFVLEINPFSATEWHLHQQEKGNLIRVKWGSAWAVQGPRHPNTIMKKEHSG